MGLAGSAIIPSVFAAWQWMVIGILLFGFVLWKKWTFLVVVACLAGFFIGVSRGSVDAQSRVVYSSIIGKQVVISGVVSEDAEVGKRGETVLRLADVKMSDTSLPATIWVSTGSNSAIARSDRITVEGELSDGFGSFAASMYRAEIRHIERPTPGDVALHMRDDFGEKVRLGIPEPQASLAMGFLAGQRRGLPEDFSRALQIAGLTHIIVASGYNLTILVRFIKRFFEKISRYVTVFLSLLLIIAFIGVTGLSPSMIRAGLVAGLALLAWYFGRKYHPITLLLFAAAITGFVDPSYVWGNLGWQLSFAAFAGVMILAPLLQVYFFGTQKPSMVRQILGETLSAQIMTLPIILYAFGQFSNVALIANVLILPLVPLAMVATFVVGCIGYVLPLLSLYAALPVDWLLSYMVFVAKYTAELSWAQSDFQLPIFGVVVVYMLIAAACWWMARVTKYSLRAASIIE